MSFNPVKIPLKTPIMHGGDEITELVFGREMVAGDLRGISVRDLTHDNVLEIASRITGIPFPILRQLRVPDYMQINELIAGFLFPSPETGESS